MAAWTSCCSEGSAQTEGSEEDLFRDGIKLTAPAKWATGRQTGSSQSTHEGVAFVVMCI